jgi:SAM-dependent methyltransferase
VLNLSAGGSEEWFEHVIEAETAVFRNTDVIADAHALPFKDASFDAIVAMNAFEHYHSPHVVASELMRCLRPGGQVAIHTAFIQPLHEAPYHFFNCTEFGLRKWFSSFEIEEISVSPNFNPAFGLSWICFELEQYFSQSGDDAALARLRALTVQDLSRFWWDAGIRNGNQFELFRILPQDVQKRFSAGFQLVARKAL